MHFRSYLEHCALFLLISTRSLNFRKKFLGEYQRQSEYKLEFLKSTLGQFKSCQISKAIADLECLASSNVSFCCWGEDAYPDPLEHITDPPLFLSYQGFMPRKDQWSGSWAIVGSRKAGPEGIRTAKKIANVLASRGQQIISGLAIGVDAAAHQGALDSGVLSSTTAVLGNGLPNIYPSSNKNLAKQIINQKGLILSHFYPFSRAFPANFLDRNRLIAGLAENILVVEAGEQSGSRVTARYALEQGKNLFVIPGEITNPNYLGSNQLIKAGAEIVTSIKDFDELVPELLSSSMNHGLNQEEDLLIKIIGNYKSINLNQLKIMVSSDLTPETFFKCLYNLEDLGRIRILPGELIQLS